jgi:prephenate dehydrogenase
MNMPVQITIIGLGQIGASIGMALGKHTTLLHRVGHDKNLSTAKKAEQKGALDEVKINLPSAVRNANIVILSLPMQEIRETLQFISEDLPEGALVMDTAPVKGPVVGWVKELLPANRYYVGMVPAINPVYLHRTVLGVEAAEADLFQDSVIMLDAIRGTPEEAVKLATDLVTLLGATPLFSDMFETDGLMSSTHLVPQLLAASLLNAVVGQPGWDDARKLAGRPFAALTSALAYQDEMDALREAAILNQENVTRVLDVVIGALTGLRDDIAGGNHEQLSERLELALDGRERWLSERTRAEWSIRDNADLSDLPSLTDRLFGTRKYLKKK